jgi:hypothetical protein
LRTTFAAVDGKPRWQLARLKVNLNPGSHPFFNNERSEGAQELLQEQSASPLIVSWSSPSYDTSETRRAPTHLSWSITLSATAGPWPCFRELSEIYEAFLEENNVHYRRCQSSMLTTRPGNESASVKCFKRNCPLLKKQLWRTSVLELPRISFDPVQIPSAREWLVLPERLSESIMDLGRRERVTTFMILLAAFKVLSIATPDRKISCRLAHRQSPADGNGIANRFLLNNLALRTDLPETLASREVPARVRKNVAGSLRSCGCAFGN